MYKSFLFCTVLLSHEFVIFTTELQGKEGEKIYIGKPSM